LQDRNITTDILGVPRSWRSLARIGRRSLLQQASSQEAGGSCPTTASSTASVRHRGAAGQPRHRDFLTSREGIGVVHPDPATSGGANWSILAEYGAGVREAGGNAEAGERLLAGIWKNVVAQAASARAARAQFDQGFGDALVTYEQEPLWDRSRGKFRGEIVHPKRTILSEHTLVVIDKHIHPRDRAAVSRFTEVSLERRAQKIFVAYGFRSVREELNAANPAFGRIEDPFLVDAFGGWTQARRDVDGVSETPRHGRGPPAMSPAPSAASGGARARFPVSVLLPSSPAAHSASARRRLSLRVPRRTPSFLDALKAEEAQFALRFSLLIAFATALTNALLGTFAAYVLSRYRFPGQRALSIVVNLPVAIPTVVVGTSLLLLWGPIGLLGRWLDPYGIQPMFAPAGVLLAHLFVTFPYMVGAVKPVLDEIETTYEEAAYTIGATAWQTFRLVLLPALKGGLFSGALLTFAHSLGEFGATVLVSGTCGSHADGSALHLCPVRGRQRDSGQRGRGRAAVLSFLIFFLLLRYTGSARRSR
jgi:ABC-type sulfate transport system permease component